MMRLLTCICALVVGVLCLSATCNGPRFEGSQAQKDEHLGSLAKGPQNESSPKPSAVSASQSDAVTVFLTGNELGQLKPCGCSGGQLGGFDRRSAVLNSVPAAERLIVDTGMFVDGDSQQELIKFNIVIQALGLLNYDVVNLTAEDIEIAKNLGLLDNIDSIFNVISPLGLADANVPAKFTREIRLKGKTIIVTVATFDAESTQASTEQIRKLFPLHLSLPTVNILILNHCDSSLLDFFKEQRIVDCLVCPSESDEPTVVGEQKGKPLIVSVGRFGKYVGRLQIRAVMSSDDLEFTFSAVPVAEALPLDESLVQLYKTYQYWVKDENLLEKQPRFVLPDGLEYVGSKSCLPCHEYEYQKWSSKAHAHAVATLEKIGSAFDPECVICHVVGAEYQSGFISLLDTPHLKDVGCENCHGPGSEHISTAGAVETTEPKSKCIDCHTPEQSAEYAGNENLYFKKIIHWREPNAADNVKDRGGSKE